MTHDWQDTPDGAELVVDGHLAASVYKAGMPGGPGPWCWRLRGRWMHPGQHTGGSGVVQESPQAAQRAAERALGLGPPVIELPEFPPPNDSESPKGSPDDRPLRAATIAELLDELRWRLLEASA